MKGVGTRLMQIWDYFMRRKLLLGVVILAVVGVFGVWRYILPQHTSEKTSSITMATENEGVAGNADSAGTGTGRLANAETVTIWNSQKMREDYRGPVEKTSGVRLATANEIEDLIQPPASEQKVAQAVEVPKTAGAFDMGTVGKILGFIALGMLICAGLTRFVFDHYIR